MLRLRLVPQPQPWAPRSIGLKPPTRRLDTQIQFSENAAIRLAFRPDIFLPLLSPKLTPSRRRNSGCSLPPQTAPSCRGETAHPSQMSAVLEPVRTRSYSSVPRRIVCEETAPLNLCERPITPPITPSPASTRQLAELALCDSLAELFSSRLRAPTHCPSAVSRDIDERELVALDSASAQPHSDTNSPSPTGTSVPVELPSSAERPPELESNTRITVTASGRVGKNLILS